MKHTSHPRYRLSHFQGCGFVAPWLCGRSTSQGCPAISPSISRTSPSPREPCPVKHLDPGPPLVSGTAPLSVFLRQAHVTRLRVLTVCPSYDHCQIASHVQAGEWRVRKRASSKRKPHPHHPRVHPARPGGARKQGWSSGRISAEQRLGDAGLCGCQGPRPRWLRSRAAAVLSC